MSQWIEACGADDIDGTVVWYYITKVGGAGTHQARIGFISRGCIQYYQVAARNHLPEGGGGQQQKKDKTTRAKTVHKRPVYTNGCFGQKVAVGRARARP